MTESGTETLEDHVSEEDDEEEGWLR